MPESDNTNHRVDRDGSSTSIISINQFPKPVHKKVKEIASANGDSVTNAYSDAILALRDAFGRGDVRTFLQTEDTRGRIQVWLRDEAYVALQQLSECSGRTPSSVAYTAIIRAFGYDVTEK